MDARRQSVLDPYHGVLGIVADRGGAVAGGVEVPGGSGDLGGLGVLLIVVLVLYVRDIPAALICALTAAALLAAAKFLREKICDLILRVIGLSSLIYVPYDIFDDTLRRSSLQSDARMLAEEIGGTTMMWGVLWLIISFAVIFMCLRRGLGRDSNLSFTR